jgi:hypothetical protein
MADCFNHCLGALGNYQKDAQILLENKTADANSNKLNIKSKIANFNTVIKTVIQNSQEKMQQIDSQVDSFFHAINECMDCVMISVSQSCEFYQSQIKPYSMEVEDTLKSGVEEAILETTQAAVGTHISPLLQQHIQT